MSKGLPWTIVWVLFAFHFAERAIHYFVIYPYLKDRGVHPALRWYVRFYSADTAAYKKTRTSTREPLSWWYVVRTLRILGIAIVTGGLYLMWSR